MSQDPFLKEKWLIVKYQCELMSCSHYCRTFKNAPTGWKWTLTVRTLSMSQGNRPRLVLKLLLLTAGLWLARRVSGTLQNSTGDSTEPWLSLLFKYISIRPCSVLYLPEFSVFWLSPCKGMLSSFFFKYFDSSPSGSPLEIEGPMKI